MITAAVYAFSGRDIAVLLDDDHALTPDRRLVWEHLGTIKMRVCRCERLNTTAIDVPRHITLEREPVHEKTKKAGAHAVACVKIA